MSNKRAAQAARFWGFDASQITLAARRENVVFRVTTPTGDFALRLHRPGYRTEAELLSELQWMAAVEAGGISVPHPVPSNSGALVHVVDDTLVDVLTWLPGRPIGATGELHDIPDPVALCRQLGAAMANLHTITDNWTPPGSFTRRAWDADGLVGEQPIWGRFLDHPDLQAEERALLQAARDIGRERLELLQTELDYGLIHADLITENIMIHDGQLSLIDFDDCGPGFRTFELATFLIRFSDKPYYPALRDALLDGYSARNQISLKDLDFFLMLRALTYVGWIIPRMDEPGGSKRSALAIQTATRLTSAYLETHT